MKSAHGLPPQRYSRDVTIGAATLTTPAYEGLALAADIRAVLEDAADKTFASEWGGTPPEGRTYLVYIHDDGHIAVVRVQETPPL